MLCLWQWLRRTNVVQIGTSLDIDDTSKHVLVGRHHEWTKIHSSYATMGGFAFDTSTMSENILPNSQTRITLTPDGLEFILRHQPDLIPQISAEDIRDKSKADKLAKFLVCTQAFWFCVQTIIRLCAGIAISLLELNTFAHALCALLVYVLWWHKPLDIAEPTIIKGKHWEEMCTLLCSHWDIFEGRRISWNDARCTSICKARYDGRHAPRPEELNIPRASMLGESIRDPDTNVIYPSSVLQEKVLDGSVCLTLVWFCQACHRRLECGRETDASKQCCTPGSRSISQRRALQLALYIRGLNIWQVGSVKVTEKCQWRIPNFLGADKLHIFIGFGAAGALYGSLHLLAWAGPFATNQEGTLWLFSASVLLSSPLAVITAFVWERYGLNPWERFPPSSRWGALCIGYFLRFLHLISLGLFCLAIVSYT